MKHFMYLLCVTLFILTACTAQQSHSGPKADLVIFSFDRPLQLYALLESVQTYLRGIDQTHVIYRASGPEYADGYHAVFTAFKHVQAHQQGNRPRADFKPLTLEATLRNSTLHVLFAVDDIVVKEPVDITECITALETHNAYGFYLRLGTHLTHCYSVNKAQPVPPHTKLEHDMISWQFNNAPCHDWGYPNTVDMTIYRKKDIEPFLRNMPYENPNTLEGRWSGVAHYVMNRIGLCYQTSKIVNLPLNRVQSVYNNRAMDEYTPRDLLTLFHEGKKIDITPLAGVRNLSAHMEYSPTFVLR